MKTVNVSALFMAALHTLDIAEVRKTVTYQVMVENEDAAVVDKVIEAMMDNVRRTMDNTPAERWNGMMEIVAEAAIQEELNGGEKVGVVDDEASQDRLKLDNGNPRKGSRK